MTHGNKVSVIIPTIEEEAIFDLIKQIRQLLGNDVEIIIVDKSSDAYYNRLKKTDSVVIRQRTKGVENAIMLGLKAAKGDILASIDADGTHDPRGLVKGVKIVESGEADLVLGNRLHSLQEGSMGFYLKTGNQLLSSLFSFIYKTKAHDVLTGLFVMDRGAFDEIRNTEPYRAGIAFFAIELARKGYKIKEVDIKYYKRAQGTSKLTRSKTAYGFNVASHIIRQLRDYSPLLIFGGLGLIVLIVGVIVGTAVILSFLHTGVFALSGRALIAFMLIILGFLLGVVGLILDLLLEIEKRLDR